MMQDALLFGCGNGPTEAHAWLGTDSNSYLLEQVSLILFLLIFGPHAYILAVLDTKKALCLCAAA
jgi:hypothetical protein